MKSYAVYSCPAAVSITQRLMFHVQPQLYKSPLQLCHREPYGHASLRSRCTMNHTFTHSWTALLHYLHYCPASTKISRAELHIQMRRRAFGELLAGHLQKLNIVKHVLCFGKKRLVISCRVHVEKTTSECIIFNKSFLFSIMKSLK